MADLAVRRLRPLPVFIGRADFGRWWEVAVFGLPLVKLPIPEGGRSSWRYLYRRSPWWRWPLIDFEVSRAGWWLYVFNFVWTYGPEPKRG